MFDLTGEVAAVTGAAQGIGREIAIAYAEAGADVLCVDLSGDDLAATANEIRARGRRAVHAEADVTEEQGMAAAVHRAETDLGPITVAFNAAGINRGGDLAESYSLDTWRKVIEVNLTGIMISCKVFAQSMLRAGHGSIINVASMSGSIVNRGIHQPDYNASKAGVIQLSKSLAVEWADRGIRVNSISPGYVATALTTSHPDWPTLSQQFVRDIPIGAIATPEDLAGPAIFLASEASSYVTGHDLVVDGGFTCW